MELNAVRRQERIQQTAKADAAVKAPAAQAPVRSAGADRLTISKEAVAHLEEQNRLFQERMEQDIQKKSREWLGEEDGGDDMLEALGKQLKVMQKCQKIAARIMAGDKVPPQDEMYLMQNDPTGYKLAMAARKPKKDPKEWESEADKEDGGTSKTSSAQQSSQGEAAPAPEPSGEAGGGGDAPSEGE